MGGRALLVEQVSQNFGGHDKDLGVRAKLDVAGHDSDSGLRKVLCQIGKFLIRQRLDGGCIEDTFALFEMVVDRKFTGLRFTRASGSTDEDVVALINGRECVFLPLVGGMRKGKFVYQMNRIDGQIGLNEIGRHSE